MRFYVLEFRFCNCSEFRDLFVSYFNSVVSVSVVVVNVVIV